MVLQVCQDLSNCLNQGSMQVIDRQKVLLGNRYLITGQGVDVAYPIVNSIFSLALTADSLCSRSQEEAEYTPLETRRISRCISKEKLASLNFLAQFMFGWMEWSFISLDRMAPAFLKQTQDNLEVWNNRTMQMVVCNQNYSTPFAAREGFIYSADSYVPGFANSYNYFVLSAVKDSASFKMALSLLAIIGLVCVQLTGEKTYKRPFTFTLITATLFFNLAILGLSIYQFTTLPKVNAGAELLQSWNNCKNSTA